ncbi:hypothetical protein ACVBIO_11665 [Shewanella sp. 0m-8]
MGRKRSQENADLPQGFYRKSCKKSASGFAFQMINPFYCIVGGLKSDKKVISLGSNFDRALQKYNKVQEGVHAWNKANPGSVITSSGLVIPPPAYIKVPVSTVVTCKSSLKVRDLVAFTRNKNKQRVGKSYDGISPTTEKNYLVQLNKIEAWWGESPVNLISSANIQAHINQLLEKESYRTAKELRSMYSKMLKACYTEGLVSFPFNPVEHTNPVKVPVKRSRISEPVLKLILSTLEKKPFLKSVIELATTTALRITDLCLIRIAKGEDWDERVKRFEQNASYRAQASQSFQSRVDLAPYSYIDKDRGLLVVYQQKTRHVVKLKLSHRVNKDLPSLGEVITDLLKQVTIDSTFLLKDPASKENKPINPVKLSKSFTVLIHQELKLDWLNDKAPTFAELRPLGRNLLQEFETELESSPTKCNSNNRITISSSIQEIATNAPLVSTSSDMLGHKNMKPMYAYLQKRDLTFQQSQGR